MPDPWELNNTSAAARLASVVILLVVASSCTGADQPPSSSLVSTTAVGESAVSISTSVTTAALPDLSVVDDFDPPTGGPYVEGTIDFWEFVVACAAQAGVHLEVIDGDPPGVKTDSATSRTDQVIERCLQVGRDQEWIVSSPFDGSQEANRLLYLLWLDVHQCLEANGYSTKPPPSEDAFAEQGSDLWNPYAAMSGAPLVIAGDQSNPGDTQQLEAQATCGADPNTLYQQHLQESTP
jgi:hypothetical protein